MPDASEKTRRMILEAGTLVILHPDGPASGFPLVVAVDQVQDGHHWFLGSCEPLRRGESLIVELPVPEDARYVTRARVVASSPETFALAIDPIWERVQQRAFVRISAHGLQVRVIRVAGPAAPTDADGTEQTDADDGVYELLDLSAGGIRFACNADFEADEEVVCHLELPGSLCFVLPGRVVRYPASARARALKPSVAVEFVGLDENSRSQLLRWIYREQVRRHRIEARQEEKARERARAREASRR